MRNAARIRVPTVSSLAAILALLGGVSALADGPAARPTLETRLRRPVALLAAGERLLVGNCRSGTITVIDPAGGRIVAEHAVAKRIADMAILDADGRIVVLDDARRELRSASLTGSGASVRPIANVPYSAAKVAVDAERRRIFVTARWPRCVVAIAFDDDFEQEAHRETIELPFAPHELLLVNRDATLLVADAFGGRMAVVDAARFRTLAMHGIHGHNIRGLAASADGKQLYVAHQRIPDRALADYEELHWGRMVTNAVRVLDVDELLRAETGGRLEGWIDEQGGIGGATGDPGGVVTGPGGVTAMAFSGVGEIVVRTSRYVKRIDVGAHPGAMALLHDRLYVANRFDDSVSVVDLTRGAPLETIPLGPAPELTAAERGEKLFFDARVSHEGWMSCHSCHTDGHSAGLLVDTLGDGDYGAPKRIPSLLGTRGTGPWGWTGSASTLAEQVHSSITTTMHGDPLSGARVADLVAYLESLDAPPASMGKPDTVLRGGALFESEGCTDCHEPPLFTSDDLFDVGLTDEHDRRRFNPPSLRGVGQRSRLFHDGRADGLEDVLRKYRHQLDGPLPEDELEALSAYLRSL